jgi:hypothetical protein
MFQKKPTVPASPSSPAPQRKLHLSKETLQRIASDDLLKVAGGDLRSDKSECGHICYEKQAPRRTPERRRAGRDRKRSGRGGALPRPPYRGADRLRAHAPYDVLVACASW